MSEREGEMSDEGGEVRIIQNLDSGEVFTANQNIPEPNVRLVPKEAVEVLQKEQEKSLEVVDVESQVTDTQRNSFKTKDFLEFLKEDSDAKLVFAHFQVHKCLDKESRGILTRTVIKKFKNDALKNVPVGEKLADFSISNKILTAISESIAEIFAGEDATIFFSPYESENGISFQKGGTLWANLCYVKERMREKGILAKSKRSQKTDKNPVFIREDERSAKALHDLENTLNTDTLIEDWRLTYNQRKNLLAINKLPVNDYISRFPCLQTQDAIKLFELDSDLGNPEKSSLLRTRWPVIKQVLIQQLEAVAQKLAKRKRNALSLDDLVLIESLPTVESDSQDAIVLYLMQILIGNARCGGKRKKSEPVEINANYQPAEIRDSFVYGVQKTQDIDNNLEDLKRKLLARKDTLQPLILVTGSWTKIEESFVIVNNSKYKVPSCVDALHLTLKILFALDCSYLRASLRLWQFVQHAAFDIVLPGESLIKSVKELVSVTKQALRRAGLILLDQPQ